MGECGKPELQIIEPCFDGQLRRYRTMERVALTCPDGREFVLRVQK